MLKAWLMVWDVEQQRHIKRGPFEPDAARGGEAQAILFDVDDLIPSESREEALVFLPCIANAESPWMANRDLSRMVQGRGSLSDLIEGDIPGMSVMECLREKSKRTEAKRFHPLPREYRELLPPWKTQQPHLNSIRWLLRDDIHTQEDCRQTGRSTLMALVYIEKALTHPGTSVTIRDHVPSLQCDKMLWDRTREIILATPEFQGEKFKEWQFRRTTTFFTIQYK